MASVVDAVVLDLDGTLLDLPVDIEAARAKLVETFAPRGFALPFRPILARIDEAATAVARDPAERAALFALGRRILDDFEVTAASSARARPGAAALVAALAARAIPVGIWTDNSRACIDLALHAAGLASAPWPADRICSRDEAPAPKPDPRGLVALVARLGATSGSRIWVIGDAERDITAAAAAAAATPDITYNAIRVTTDLAPITATLLSALP